MRKTIASLLIALGGLTAAGNVLAAESWPVVCQADARTHLVYTPSNGGWLRITGLRPASRGHRDGLPGPGQCSWYDRPMNRDGEMMNGRLEFSLRLSPSQINNLRMVPLGRGSGILARDGYHNDFFIPLVRGEHFRFMARRTGRGRYEITSLNYDTSMFSRRNDRLPYARPAPSDTERSRPSVTARPAPYAEDCLSFNRGNLRVKRIQGRWKIVDGNHWLFDFGPNRNEADKALRIIHHYRMDKVCYVGRPNPGMTYLLSAGKAPRGSMPGEDCVSFNPKRVQAKQVRGSWKVVDGGHWMFDFGKDGKNARKAASLIKKYGFSKSCFVGRPGPSFKYLRR